MKININILPEKQKETMKKEKKIGLFMKLFFSVIIVLFVLNVVFFLMQLVLGIELQAVRRSSTSSSENNAGKENQLEKTFKEANIQVANLSKIIQNIPDWAKVLMKISDLVPEGIHVYQITADESVLKISGFSKTRDNFLEFQNKLKEEGFQFPVDISNLVSSNDFNFNLNLNIPKGYLIRK